MNKNFKTFTINPEILEDLKKLTTARFMALSSDVKLSIGSIEYSKDEILLHVDACDEIGQQVMQMQLEFLQNLASGSLYDE